MSDNRKVSTDALETLGTIITPNEKRDAIHLAVLPVEAAEKLNAGDHINVKNGMALRARESEALGIVDPFLTEMIFPGQMFWMVIKPRTITSLRHVWSHPSLPDEPRKQPKSQNEAKNKANSEKWLRNFCKTADCPPYEITVAAAAHGWSGNDGEGSGENDGEYLFFSGIDAHGEIPPEFWHHVEIVTGKTITDRPKYFSCSC